MLLLFTLNYFECLENGWLCFLFIFNHRIRTIRFWTWLIWAIHLFVRIIFFAFLIGCIPFKLFRNLLHRFINLFFSLFTLSLWIWINTSWIPRFFDRIRVEHIMIIIMSVSFIAWTLRVQAIVFTRVILGWLMLLGFLILFVVIHYRIRIAWCLVVFYLFLILGLLRFIILGFSNYLALLPRTCGINAAFVTLLILHVFNFITSRFFLFSLFFNFNTNRL